MNNGGKNIAAKSIAAIAAAAVSTGIFADVQYDEAEVVDVEPIVEQVEYVEPKERCWFETVQRRQRQHRSSTAPLFGAIIGGAIGNAVGHEKRNKQVGAVVGALLGGSLARDISRQNHADDVRPVRRVRREVCEVVEQTKTRERVAGYMVTYRYQGETHRARMDQRPGERIRVRVRVAPA